ncbi:acyl-CoA dehydrogenase [Streptomyces ipomoeae]|uniref:Acyl-CoA dehydrogenase, C-terminal domain protein n=2 Tax=Streptomyces ipomoeae TaxID=103232 RepID=L1KS73_9ACTN|nr:acyl-CoA dehydrogenase family protein [Streptomyces ipomoeae]EKX63228.1 acyl-CoA dehydrogenase, C-terminal domain protein [Streptomyces ipomoeae 91-03]MDX2695260.1 acyl-CoA dehydrogenase family protein [Streptomyces ipomoeae]MDX2823546.1 acyl-CoA dehydrogenase family protein [Streptomyces ipomoeae]MDX2841003.1 acyl-CoA dehydrogenase family protein [Streptomyces ipomoeae]MDX2875667.1 acyl-CoA dehydrogenase family protein [Streptomyces ipomoeae]
MHLEYTPEQHRLRTELRAYFAELVPEDAHTRHVEPAAQKRFYRETIRRLGTDGWLGVGWPKEYGGRGLTAIEQFIFFDEAAQAGVPLPLMALNTVGPTIMQFGTEEQKSYFLPRILSGEIDFAIGYSEPDAGTDLASLKTRAVRDGDEYIVNGQKIWTTNGDTADWVWLATRTDPDAPPHKGITMLLVPTTDPGYSCTLIRTLASHDTTASYYENVRVPVSRRVGEENKGWRLITNQLNHERVTLAAHGTMAIRSLHNVQRWAMETKLADGRRVIDLPWVRRRLAQTHTRLDALKLLNWRMVSAVQDGTLTPQDASAVKVYGSEARRDAYAWLMEIVATVGALKEGSAGAALHGELERGYRSAVIFTFGGGNNEIQREIISWIGLGMPRVRR